MLHTFFGDPTRFFFFASTPREFCEANNGFRTSIQGLAAYTLPKVDVQVSASFQNLPGAVVQSNANYSGIPGFPGAAGSGPFIPFKTVQIVEPGSLYVERLNQIDLRFAKLLRFGRTRTSVNFDFYNVTNSNSVLAENPAYSPSGIIPGWRSPTQIVLPRLFKFSAQFDF
jgi:hypothetical protein